MAFPPSKRKDAPTPPGGNEYKDQPENNAQPFVPAPTKYYHTGPNMRHGYGGPDTAKKALPRSQNNAEGGTGKC